MASNLDRGLDIIELLARSPDGMPLHEIADTLSIPRSATHRLLVDLTRRRYVRQHGSHSAYQATTRIAALGLGFLADLGFEEVTRPTLRDLAEQTQELVRLALIDDGNFLWVGKIQGARGGLRYEPYRARKMKLSCSASGVAWLMGFSDEEALEIVSRDGFPRPGEFGPNAPTTAGAFLDLLRISRSQGYAVLTEGYEAGVSVIAAPVFAAGGDRAVGVLNVTGPIMRLPEAKLHDIAPAVMQAASELSIALRGSRFARRSETVSRDPSEA